jgi:hypothetical protein
MSRKTTRSGARGGGAASLPAIAGAGTGAGSPLANAQSQSTRLADAARRARLRLSTLSGMRAGRFDDNARGARHVPVTQFLQKRTS